MTEFQRRIDEADIKILEEFGKERGDESYSNEERFLNTTILLLILGGAALLVSVVEFPQLICK